VGVDIRLRGGRLDFAHVEDLHVRACALVCVHACVRAP
jgi:hypothetical protein